MHWADEASLDLLKFLGRRIQRTAVMLIVTYREIVRPDEAAIEGCLSIGMVFSDDSTLAFRHEQARRAFEDTLSSSLKQSLNARVLEVLTERPGIPAARLAHHADGARNAEQNLRFAPLAASQAAAVGAHREAAAFYDLALRYADGLPDEDRALLHEALAYVCYVTSQPERAIAARLSAVATWRASGARL